MTKLFLRPVVLPPETLEFILGHLERGELLSVLLASSALHQIGARVLYRTLVDVPAQRTLRLVKTLASNDVYPPLVHRFDLEWTDNVLTANFLRLLHRALGRLTRLTHLALAFSPSDSAASLAWILPDCPSPLRLFATSMRCDAGLAQFLASQDALVEVGLRWAGGYAANPVSSGAGDGGPNLDFPLPPSALPRLRHFRTGLPAPGITAAFLRDRPVECVSLSFPCEVGVGGEEVSASLDALRLSACGVTRLTVLMLSPGGGDGEEEEEPATPTNLLAAIAARVPALEALHAVILARPLDRTDLLDASPVLARFEALRYLTYVGPRGDRDGDAEAEREDEREVAESWGRACPTLRTIMLPRGVMWGCVDGRWVALHDS